ncbi:hypothetical protein Tery_4325 [Trichodesmium erythraeum IMS101]|uniref:Uncharacterized protein n=1 Tax=Trichodesmium erythraeum (strain IMS101) TaxID=203124 RepID=Q10WQ6_TRIEI|nr:hypothetical protein [Trichodesmium sp. ALOHA_ZT_67]MDE5096127.1 hypothetical protein [Trichodesmium sp. St11_bin5]MDT9338227.1 hypothetical protein [Trichodesmium erythraeum 21-75]
MRVNIFNTGEKAHGTDVQLAISQGYFQQSNIDSDICQESLDICVQFLRLGKIQRHIFIGAYQTKPKFCLKKVVLEA